MANLYEINHDIESCVDAETGEILDFERLESLIMERDTKIENIACWIKNLQSDAAAIKAEIEGLSARKESYEKKAASLKAYLTSTLNGEKFSSGKCAVTWRKSESVEVDENLLPKKYFNKVVSIKPDKIKLKELLKSGKVIKGATLNEKLNPQIK